MALPILSGSAGIENVAFKRGNKVKNDAYIGPPRTISIDTESKNIRVHDGVTPGGHIQGGQTTGPTLLFFNTNTNLGSFKRATAISTSIVATSLFGKTVTYSVVNGSFPSGVSMNATGVISGTSSGTANLTTYTLTVQATDGITTISQQFNITLTA